MGQSGSFRRRNPPRASVDRARIATPRTERFGPPKAGFSQFVDCVMALDRSPRPLRKPCLATKHQKPVKRVRI